MIKTQIINKEIYIILLNRKPVNALNIGLLNKLYKVIHEIDVNNFKALVIGSSFEHFSAGADLTERNKFSYDETIDFLDKLKEVFEKLANLEIPTIAAINGACLGGGLELALSCDFRISTNSALFGFPETSIGIIPGAGGTQRLTRLVGSSIAMKWIFTAEKLSAEIAYKDGLVDFMLKDGDPLEEAIILAQKISKNAPLSIKSAKSAINSSFIDHGFLAERKEYLKTLNSNDRKEGLDSFKEKRAPKWKNT